MNVYRTQVFHIQRNFYGFSYASWLFVDNTNNKNLLLLSY